MKKNGVLFFILGIGLVISILVKFELYQGMWLGGWGLLLIVVGYIFKLVFESYLTEIVKKAFERLTFIKGKIKLNVSQVHLERAKDILESQVRAFCEKTLKEIEESEITLIRELNWQYVAGTSTLEINSRNLIDVFNETKKGKHQSFIVIGDAGVGKTTALFQFMLASINNKKEKESVPVPVLFSLSSWEKNYSLEEYLVKQLVKIFNIAEDLSKELIRGFYILPILDGLDQMSKSLRREVLLNVKDFTSLSGTVGITSRIEVYEELYKDFNEKDDCIDSFLRTYKLLPLEPEQVDRVVNQLDNKIEINRILSNSSRLKSFVRYPMALFLLSKVSSEVQAEQLAFYEWGDDLQIFDKLWQKYDDYIFDQTSTRTGAKSIETSKYRYWIKKLSRDGQGMFFIENLQPSFLTNNFDRLLYYFLSRTCSGIALMWVVGFYLSGPFEYIGSGVFTGLILTIICYIDQFYRIGFKLSGLRFKLNYIINSFIYGIPISLGLIIYFGFTTPRDEVMLFNGLFSPTEANVGVFISLFFGVVFGQRSIWQSAKFDIKPVETVSVDWNQFLKFGFFGGISIGVILTLCVLIMIGFFENSIFLNWVQDDYYNLDIYFFAFITGFVCGFPLIGMIGWFRNKTQIDPKDKQILSIRSNYGIRRSILNSVRAGVISSIFFCVIFGLFFGLTSGEFTSLIKGIKAGLGGGLLGALWFGGFDVIQHYVLRILIFIKGYGPLNYQKFFTDLSKKRLIRTIGASFVFIHPTLQTYFNRSQYNRNTIVNKRSGRQLIIPCLLVLLFLCSVFPFYKRFSNRYFWKNTNGFEFLDLSDFAVQLDSNQIGFKNVNKGGFIELIAYGSAKVGSFTGYTSPGGTEAGFVGFKIGDTYDFPEGAHLSHAALMFKFKKDSIWKQFPKDNIFNILNPYRKIRLTVTSEDTLQFMVNDKEYHNNTKKYKIKFKRQKEVKTKIISHRGAAGLAPENTLVGVRMALESGAQIVEIDIRQTSDNQIILLHDEKINRTTNGKGKISDIDWKELQSYFIKHKDSEHLLVPKLADALDIIRKSNSKLLIELKEPSSYVGIGERLNSLIEERGMIDKVLIYSFDQEYIKEFKKLYPKYKVGIFALRSSSLNTFPELHGVGIFKYSLMIFPSTINKLQQQGFEVFAWSVNNIFEMQSLIDKGVNGIITDHPNMLNKTINN